MFSFLSLEHCQSSIWDYNFAVFMSKQLLSNLFCRLLNNFLAWTSIKGRWGSIILFYIHFAFISRIQNLLINTTPRNLYLNCMKKTTVCVWGVSKMHEVQQAGGIRKCEDFCIRIASGLAFVSNRTIVYCKARCH